MLLIFVDNISNRLTYTLDFIFRLRKIEFRVTTIKEEFRVYSGVKLNYSNENFEENSLWIKTCGLLDEEELIIRHIEYGEFYGQEILRISNVEDILSSIFYVLTSMEEYLSTERDNHGRFLAEFSKLKEYEWLETPICDIWSEKLIDTLNATQNGNTPQNEKLFIETPKFKIVPTFDIDNTFAYKNKNWIRRMLSISKDTIYGNKTRLKERRIVLRNQKLDPYDTFDDIKNICKKFDTRIFWLLGKFSKFDKNLPSSNLVQQNLIQNLDEVCVLGLHPSYESNNYDLYLQKEKKDLEEIVSHPIKHSRQHFLKVELPKTYKILLENNFEHDYSMGFADHIGFRLGTARAINWFNLENSEVTKLVLHPFVYMDGTLREYQKLSIEESKLRIRKMYDLTKQYGGEFQFLWHNETIGNYSSWKGWREVLDFTLNLENE